jgi:prevent-host-death family protein
MSTMTVAEAKYPVYDVRRRAEYGGERVIVERHGKPVAVIVSTEDLRRLEAADDAADVRDARAALAEAGKRGTTSLEAVLRKHGLTHLLAEPAATTRRSRPTAKIRPAVKRSRNASRRVRRP